VEHTDSDQFWGDGGGGKGQNKLGILLMRVRNLKIIMEKGKNIH
jgi:predicted NAD-dependent protein-ADP-ribosyltransferase YbiA (DUF1768 family)